MFGRSDFHYRHESIFYGWVPGASHRAPEERTHDSVWEFPKPRRSEQHPTMKPVALVSKALGISGRPGELALDPFLGSGTTLIAGHRLGQRVFGLELSPAYCDVIVDRWEKLSGGKAKRKRA